NPTLTALRELGVLGRPEKRARKSLCEVPRPKVVMPPASPPIGCNETYPSIGMTNSFIPSAQTRVGPTRSKPRNVNTRIEGVSAGLERLSRTTMGTPRISQNETHSGVSAKGV